MCPAPGPKRNCFESCSSQSDCKRHDVCCSDGCGCACVTPVRTGACPAVKPGDEGICVELCNRDQDCINAGQKCCFNGCGHVCVDPVNVKSGTCTAPQAVLPCPKHPTFECANDDDCNGDWKCCDDGACGKECTRPGTLYNVKSEWGHGGWRRQKLGINMEVGQYPDWIM